MHDWTSIMLNIYVTSGNSSDDDMVCYKINAACVWFFLKKWIVFQCDNLITKAAMFPLEKWSLTLFLNITLSYRMQLQP